MYVKNIVAANEGNLSIRIEDRLIATPSGACKGFLKPDDLAVTDLAGEQLEGERKVSSEILMHAAVYRRRSDVAAVCHGHPTHATAHAVAGIPLDEALLPEGILILGSVPIAPYGTPSTHELADSLSGLVEENDAVLLANHGALTYDSDLEKAFFKMEILEHMAEISIMARLLGNRNLLPRASVEQLLSLRERYGLTPREAGYGQKLLAAEDIVDKDGKAYRVTRKELEEAVQSAVSALLEGRAIDDPDR